MLHLLAQTQLTDAIVQRISAGDAVLLQHGSIWAALSGHADNAKLAALQALPCQIYVMQDMLQASGITVEQLFSAVNVIDYPGLVELTVSQPQIVTWC